MSDTPEKPDYRSTVFLPKTDFPMKAGLPQKEPGILAKWQANDAYGQIRAARAGREKFILHDGPPYANGDIHIGHALNHILKDMVVRTQTLLGKDAPYVPGWDCHGLPIEWKVEEQYRKKKLDKDQVPIKEFRAECRAYAQGWVDVQREQLKRLGIGGQWDKPYLTMNSVAEGTIVSELLKFAETGQLYRGAKPVMWSPVEKTALAEAEIEYEDIVSTQVDVAFEIVESPAFERDGWFEVARSEGVPVLALVWTTTPWTIPVNQAVAYGPDVQYALLHFNEAFLLVALDRLQDTIGRIRTSDIVKLTGSGAISWTGKGSDLVGTIARHPMHHLASSPLVGEDRGGGRDASASQETLESDGAQTRAAPTLPSPQGGGELADFFLRPRPFLPGDFVTTETGTGLVHMAPDHGEDDFDLCKSNGIDPVFAVEGDGKYRADWAWLGGQGSVINAKFNAPDGPICEDLRAAGGLLAASADYQHSYPHSWRSKAKVIYRCTPQWFIAMDAPLTSSPLVGEDARGSDVPRTSEALSGGQGDLAHGGGRDASASQENLSAADAAGPPPASPTRGEGSREGAMQRWENEGGHLAQGRTLRETALNAISATRWVPAKGENRIRSMAEGRPDWVISRQRAWGVPIALFVKRGGNQPLVDDAVNARIVAAIKAEGVDAWEEARAQEYLGADYDLADYEMVTDILDVWFDSGCTHVFTLESGTWPDLSWPADLYLEGSDQHRGWFQSSLMESCGTRGRAPYDAVLTHGFTMDSKGMKMSKSLGNTINPLDLMRDYGADILRLWALSVDFTEDHRIGKEILAGVADQYRKLRNTFRYLLGALEGFSEAERVAPETMPELERYMLSLLAGLDARLRTATEAYDFNDYVRALGDFCNEDLSAFYFDIRKDSLYCDAADDPKRMAYRTVLDTLFHALVRWAAPVLVFTAEEVWGTRYPEGGSVHLLEWPEIGNWSDETRDATWRAIREEREAVTEAIEPLRREKIIRSSLEADVELHAVHDLELLAEVCIVSSVKYSRGPISVTKTDLAKCGRCWRHLPEVREDGDLCNRCEGVVNG